MTNYSRAYEEQRNDKDLKNLVFLKLQDEQESYAKSEKLLQEIYDNTSFNRAEIYGLLEKAKWKNKFLSDVISKYPEDDTYVGNKAAFMSQEDIKGLKAKYGDQV